VVVVVLVVVLVMVVVVVVVLVGVCADVLVTGSDELSGLGALLPGPVGEGLDGITK
jgi:hypothetical protein